MFILRTQPCFRMYLKLEFTQGGSIEHPIAAYKLPTVYFAKHTSYDVLKAGKGLKETVICGFFFSILNATFIHLLVKLIFH